MKLGANYLGNGQCEFTLWAPFRQQVAVHLTTPQERLVPLQQDKDGYWRGTLDNIQPGDCYFYQLDGDHDQPDPASHFQPEGVHGPSAVVDHSTFNWTDRDWQGIPLADYILYELHVGTFTPEGSFDAIIPRLLELKAVGINAIELMPVAQFPGDRNWGYDGVFLYAVQNSYGGPEGLKRLIDACHQHGIAVVLDVVFNHFGPEGNCMSHFGPYFTHTYRTPWGDAINFDDAHSPDVRLFFLQNALHWLETYHFDALRLDATQAIYDLGANHFLKELAETVSPLSQHTYPRYLIAESDLNNVQLIRPIDQHGFGLDAQWSDDFHHALHTVLTGASTGYYQDFGTCTQLAKAYQDTFVYDWQYAPHRHRFHGAPVGDRPYAQFVVCIQNHDQVGNQMVGDRLCQLVSFEKTKLAAAAVLLSPYIPLLFMGEEYGETAPFTYFVSHTDPDLIKAVREGRQNEFAAFHFAGHPPDPADPETFQSCKLNWELRHTTHHQTLLTFHQTLIHLRRTLPALRPGPRGTQETQVSEAGKLITLHRHTPNHQVAILLNFNETPVTFTPNLPNAPWHLRLNSAAPQWLGSSATVPETLSPAELTIPQTTALLYESPNS